MFINILFSGKSASMIRNRIVSILTKFNTSNLNLEVKLVKGGWTRTIRQCLFVRILVSFRMLRLLLNT